MPIKTNGKSAAKIIAARTGRIDYAPDYKSEKRDHADGKQPPTIEEMSGSIDFGGRVVFDGDDQCIVTTDELERQRLERDVIEGARIWFKLNQTRELEAAMIALLEFESKQDHEQLNGKGAKWGTIVMSDEWKALTEDEWRTQILDGEVRCLDCLRRYGAQHGFPDLVIPNAVWERISPTGNEGGLLCPSCICKRLHDAGIRCEGAFMSGPIVSVSEQVMWLIGRVNNLEREMFSDQKEPS